MNNSEEILNELKAISPLLAGLIKINVFKVPEGYFDLLEERLANFAISNSLNELVFNKTNAQKVPDGYFDSLSTNILAKIKQLYPETWDEEIRNLSPMLYSLKHENVFQVPTGYFEYFADGIINQLKPAYAKLNELHTETAVEEVQILSPVLYSLKNINVFKVPVGYFENFAGEVIKKLEHVTAKVITMKPRSSWMKIAVAAVVTGIIAISSLEIFNNFSNSNNRNAVITTASVLPNYVKESFQFKTEEQLDAGIAKLSDDEIIKYLEKNGNAMDNDLLLNNTDASELPNQNDYLYDVNTLNSYLDKTGEKGND